MIRERVGGRITDPGTLGTFTVEIDRGGGNSDTYANVSAGAFSYTHRHQGPWPASPDRRAAAFYRAGPTTNDQTCPLVLFPLRATASTRQ